MKLIKGAWKLLVGIKDFMVLCLLLLFFTLLYVSLTQRPNAGSVREGALLITFKGSLSEQPAASDPFSALSGGSVTHEMRLRDVLHALDTARTDDRVKAVVLDLDRFVGGYPAAISAVGDAVGAVRAAKKPVLAYATGYSDDSYAIAANASEVWTHPMGGALFTGPGGSQLYYKGLLDKLGVNAHIYRVGKYKSATEPFARNDMSAESREAAESMYGILFTQWKEAVAKARPQAKLQEFLTQPDAAILLAEGDVALANKNNGLVDTLGDRLAFGKRVGELVGAPTGKAPGAFNAIQFSDYLAAHPTRSSGNAIGVLTVAGEIVDGKAGPGTAAGETVSQLLLKGLAEKDLKALVVRIDSPGGSVFASEQIRQAVLEAKNQGLPVVISMGSLAASGGYWVATAGDVIFAEPSTLTGSIGIFGVLPTFEKALAKVGLGVDGVRTTPLTAQPDLLAGTNSITDRVLQASIENGYARFLALVSSARNLPIDRVDALAQGRVWVGGTAHQLKLVDQFGGMEEALAEAARRANLEPASTYPLYLESSPSGWRSMLADLVSENSDGDWVDTPPSGDLFARVANAQQAQFVQAVSDVRRLAGGGSMQARCLECIGVGRPALRTEDRSLLELLLVRLLG